MPIKQSPSLSIKKVSKPIKKTVKSVRGAKASVSTTSVVQAKVKPLKNHTERIAIHSPKGESIGSVSLPASFASSYNVQLVSQAIRVYRMNQHQGAAATKTRSMVEGSTRKIYRQKGTGRARHGGIRAPIFVGGGIALGPQSRIIRRNFPQQMRKKALMSALSYKIHTHAVVVVDALDTLPLKTKTFVQMFSSLEISGKTLFVYSSETATCIRAVRNIYQIQVCPVWLVNTYDVMTHRHIVFTKDAFEKIIKQYQK